MKIALIMKGTLESTDHILLMNQAELQDMLDIHTFYCENNKRKIKAKRTLKQLEDQLQIY